jgi:FkbM family methyltransferase
VVGLRRFIPLRIRPVATKGRDLALKVLGAPSTPTVVASTEGANYDTEATLQLLYGPHMSDATRDRAHGALNGSPVIGVTSVRQLLGTLDRQLSPTPFSVRFRRDDVRFVTFDGVTLALDTADASVSQPILSAGVWEPHLTTVFRRFVKPGHHVIDVGANIGYFTMLSAGLCGPSGHVSSIEPNSENCRLILASAARNEFTNVELIPVALDQHRGWAHFGTNVGSNGSLRQNSTDDILDGAGQIVPAFPLDELITRPVDFIKLDVEGAEHRAVLGATGIIERDRPIVTSEFSIEMIERVSGVPALDYLTFFTDRGYTINIIDRVDATLRPHATAQELLDSWPGHLHLEDLLFAP